MVNSSSTSPMETEEESTQIQKEESTPMPMEVEGASQPEGEGGGMNITAEEEAHQAINMLKGDDTSERIAAANKLESIAKTLGEERTRNVSQSCAMCHVTCVVII